MKIPQSEVNSLKGIRVGFLAPIFLNGGFEEFNFAVLPVFTRFSLV